MISGTLSKLLESLPHGFAWQKEYRGISWIEPIDIKGKHKKNLDVTARRGYLNFVKSIFVFAEEKDYVQKNPVISGIIPPKKKNSKCNRDPVSDPDDLDISFGRKSR